MKVYNKKISYGIKFCATKLLRFPLCVALAFLHFTVNAEFHEDTFTYSHDNVDYMCTLLWKDSVEVEYDGCRLHKNRFTIQSFKMVSRTDSADTSYVYLNIDELFNSCDFSDNIWIDDPVTNYYVTIAENAFNTDIGYYKLIDINSTLACRLELGEKAFRNAQGLNLFCADSVELWKIGVGACAGSSIATFPWDKVQIIGACAFQGAYGCDELCLCNVTNIGMGAFQQSSLRSIELGDRLQRISAGAFYKCDQMTNVTINAKAVAIGNYAFCGSGLERIQILGQSFFDAEDCNYWQYGDYESWNTHGFSYGIFEKPFFGVFSECKSLKSVVLPDCFWGAVLPKECFANCINLNEVAIPEGVEEVGYGAFRNCASLTTLNIPSSLKRVRGAAFVGCSGLMSLNLANVTTIDSVKNEYQG